MAGKIGDKIIELKFTGSQPKLSIFTIKEETGSVLIKEITTIIYH